MFHAYGVKGRKTPDGRFSNFMSCADGAQRGSDAAPLGIAGLVKRTFCFIKYGKTDRSFIDIMIENRTFFIGLTAGERVTVFAPGVCSEQTLWTNLHPDLVFSERSAACKPLFV